MTVIQRSRGIGSLVGFLVLVAAAAVTGAQFEPGPWYAQLAKPAWTPPSWVFGPVWTMLYIAIALAGWLVWRAAHAVVPALIFWAVQLVLNAAWSALFFGLHAPAPAFANITLLIVCILGFITTAWAHSRAASLLFLPYALWVAFAAALNLSIARLN